MFTFVRRFIFTRVLRSRFRRLHRVNRRVNRITDELFFYGPCRYSARLERRLHRLLVRKGVLSLKLFCMEFNA